MKFTQKNIIFSIIFLLGIILTNNFYILHCKTLNIIEFASENKSSSNDISSDFEIHEEDQNFNSTEILAIITTILKHQYFHATSKPTMLFYTIWQPPKLS